MSSTAAAQRQPSLSSATSSSIGGSTDGASGGNGGGILCNAHEAPKRTARAESGIKSTLIAAFTHQQPGKQMKTNGKPLGKSFQREQPLPQSHAGGEVLKIDPRGPDAPVGDGVVLSPTSVTADSTDETASASSPQSSIFEDASAGDVEDQDDDHQSRRQRSDTISTQQSESSESSHPCRIKFAPLPTSGRLKRANSITIGVAARSQLLQSQGGGRQQNNAQAWQNAMQQQHHQGRSGYGGNTSSSSGPKQTASRYSGIQSSEAIDLGEEMRKGALKVWSRVRRGSSVSSSGADGGGSGTGSRARSTSREHAVVEEAEEEQDESKGKVVTGEKTPIRSSSPVHYDLGPDDHEPEGARTPRRRLSTGAFIGHASFRQMEERRKRGDYVNDESENEATRFIEMLGHTGASKEVYHHVDGPRRVRSDQQGKDMDTVVVAEPESDDGQQQREEDDDEDDDEETREAERLANQALEKHTEQANRAGAVEKMERRGSGG